MHGNHKSNDMQWPVSQAASHPTVTVYTCVYVGGRGEWRRGCVCAPIQGVIRAFSTGLVCGGGIDKVANIEICPHHKLSPPDHSP